MWQNYFSVSNIGQALDILAQEGDQARIIAGGTDLVLEIRNGIRPGLKAVVDISHVKNLDTLNMDSRGWLHLGPMVTHNDCIASAVVREKALPLAQAAWQVGSPQIRNRGTIAGNLVTASPANDTIAPLIALGARLTLRSAKGDRIVPLEAFYTGVRKTTLHAGEVLVDIAVPGMREDQVGIFLKQGLRNAQAISVVNVAIVLGLEGDLVNSASITLGSVAPTVIHATAAEKFLTGLKLDEANIREAADLAAEAAAPIKDIRSSAEYRHLILSVLVRRGLQTLWKNQNPMDIPEKPVLLRTPGRSYQSGPPVKWPQRPIETTLNRKKYSFDSGYDNTLLHLVREDAGLTGAKEGCGEGECGACTVWMDGMAVLSCLIPAPQAHGAEIVTIEGLAPEGALHPLQKTILEDGAVQCGYCTPGVIMSGAKLLEEKKDITREDIKQSISGNLCRCTGYFKIIEAIEHAAALSK